MIATSEALATLQAFVSHGVQDSKLSIEFARSAQRLLGERKVKLAYREYAADHELNRAMQGDFSHWIARQFDIADGSGRTKKQ